jgi:hypothetical protein
VQDTLYELNETVVVDISTVVNGTENGTQRVTATITDDDAPPPTRIIGVSGNLAFGNVTMGTTATATLTMTNGGNAILTVSGISYPTGFSGAWNGTIAPSGSQNVTATFAPLAATSYGGTVTVNSDATSGTGTLAASGTGTPVPTPFQTWQLRYFGCTNCSQAADSADPDGDGQNNESEFLMGTCPTNSASAFRILSITPEASDLRVTWQTVGGKTNVVQAAAIMGGDFTNISPNLIILGTGDTTTNWLDPGAVTNWPARFYRILLVP